MGCTFRAGIALSITSRIASSISAVGHIGMFDETKSATTSNDALLEQVERRLAAGALLAQRGEHLAAIATFEMALELVPDYADTYLSIGIAYERLNEWDRALEYYNRAIELDPDGKKSPQRHFVDQAYFGRGNLRARIKDFSGAIEDFTRRIASRPTDARAYVQRGSCAYQLQDYHAALKDFTSAIELDPASDYSLYNKRSDTYYKLGAYRESVEDLTRSLELNPDQPEVYFNRGLTYLDYINALNDSPRHQDIQKVIDDYSQAIQLKSDNAMFHYKRGTCHVLMDNLTEGKKDLSLAIQLFSAEGDDAHSQKAAAMLELVSKGDIQLPPE
jgi:tetratricopeptide (TPR) repeat protein